MTEAEIELLQQLAKRREKLEQRADTLNRRESLVKAAEKRLTQKVGEMERLRTEIEDLLVKYDEQETQQLTRLVNIYEKMKPKDAARIFEDLDQEVLLKVVERMNERKTAPILAEMRPDKAQQLTIELAERLP
jgi:flagellar motility protein MotE (MotC chaperone)